MEENLATCLGNIPHSNGTVAVSLITQAIFSSIGFFEVGNFVPWISDHCPIRFQLDTCMINESQSDVQGGEELESLFWDDDSPAKFTEIFRTHEQEIRETLTLPPNTNILEKFQKIVKSVVDEGKFKKRRTKTSNDAVWFDNDCKKAKEEVRVARKNIQCNPNELSLRKILTDKKKNSVKL